MNASSSEFLEICKRHRVDPKVIAAMITIESEWNPTAIRYEPGFKYLFAVEDHARALRITADTEATCQKCSVGLGQLMVGTARWLGFGGPMATLFEPHVNVDYTCRYYARLSERYAAVSDRVAAYNAGSVRRTAIGTYVNQGHVEKFWRALANG